MSDSEQSINSISFITTVALHVGLLLIPACTTEIELGPYAGKYNIPVQLSGKSDKPQATEPIQEKEIVKDNNAKRGKTIKDKHLTSKPSDERLPGDREAPAAYGQPKPIPPKIAINNEWKGTVILEVQVDATGRVLGYKVLQSTGYKELDESFIKTVQTSYSFKPKRIMGKDQTGTVTVSYTFDL